VTRAIVERLARKLEELGQMRGSNDPDPLIQYAVMAGEFAVLMEMVQEGHEHPRTVYREIVRLVGALLFRDSLGRSVEIIPRYDHRDPGPVFQALQELVFSLCDPRDVRQYERCPMVRSEDEFNVVLPDSAKQAGSKCYVELESSEPQQQLSLKMMTARISIPSRIEFLRVNGLPGVPTEAQPGPPPALPRGQTATYYRLKHEEKEWKTHVVGAGELAVFIMNCPADVAINLVVVMPDA
jgi:type VI secretion system protein ImpJ